MRADMISARKSITPRLTTGSSARLMSSMSLEQRSDNRTAQALSRGLQRLQHPAVADGNVGVRKRTRTLRLRPAALQRLLDTLAERRFVEQTAETWKYAVGHRAFMVGRACLAAAA